MQGGVDEFRAFMEGIPFSPPRSDMMFNATAQCETDPERIKDIMANQLVSPVKWYDIMRKMLDDGIDTFVEVGPKKVLAGLLKKISTLPDVEKIDMLSLAEADEERELITRLSVSPGFALEDIEQNIDDCIMKINRRELDRDIQEAEKTGDMKLLQDLIVKRQNLLRANIEE